MCYAPVNFREFYFRCVQKGLLVSVKCPLLAVRVIHPSIKFIHWFSNLLYVDMWMVTQTDTKKLIGAVLQILIAGVPDSDDFL